MCQNNNLPVIGCWESLGVRVLGEYADRNAAKAAFILSYLGNVPSLAARSGLPLSANLQRTDKLLLYKINTTYLSLREHNGYYTSNNKNAFATNFAS